MSKTNTREPEPSRQRLRSGKKGVTRPTRVVLRLPDVSRREAAPAAADADDLPDLDTETIEKLHGGETAEDNAAEQTTVTGEVEPAKREQRSKKKRRGVNAPRSRWGSWAMQGLIVLSLVGILGLAYVVIIGLGSGAAPEEEVNGPMMPGDPTAEIAGVGELQITAPTGEVEAPEWATPPGNAFQAESPATDMGQPVPKATGLNLESPQLDAGYTPGAPPSDAVSPTPGSEAEFASTTPAESDTLGAPVPWQETPTSPVYQYNRTDASKYQYPPYEEAGVTAGNGFSNTGVQR